MSDININIMAKIEQEFDNEGTIKYFDSNDEEVNFDEGTWKVIESYLEFGNPWTQHQIGSYNECLRKCLKKSYTILKIML